MFTFSSFLCAEEKLPSNRILDSLTAQLMLKLESTMNKIDPVKRKVGTIYYLFFIIFKRLCKAGCILYEYTVTSSHGVIRVNCLIITPPLSAPLVN